MRNWAIPVVITFIGLLTLSVYLLVAALEMGIETGNLLTSPVFGIWVSVLAISQFVLLIRVRPLDSRPRARRKMLPAVIAGALCFALLFFMIVITLASGFGGDDALDGLEEGSRWIIRTLGLKIPASALASGIVLTFFLAQWIAWGTILWRTTRQGEPDSIVARWCRWLLAGSVIELLVAVPCHVATRRRDDCCAPIMTLWGMVTGISLLLLSVGPSVMFLYSERMRSKRKAQVSQSAGQAPPADST